MASVEFTREDCLDLLRSLQDDSVDLVLTDPPYFIGYEGQSWDNQWRDEAAYLDWCRRWKAECARVLKPGRMLIVWGTLKTDTFLRYKLDVLNSFPELTGQNEIIWSYNWGGRSKANFARKHEYAWCYSKGERFLFHGDDVRVPRKMDKNMRTGGLHTTGMIPTSVWEVNNHTNSKDFVNWHPTTKNLAVLDRMIRAYTNPGDTVLDPFMGSASTAIAALRADRNAIGCERSVFYFSKASARIEAEEARLSLSGTTPGTGSS